MKNKTYQLPKEFAEKWVRELRSGKYKQIQNTLCKDGGYCCLGVAGKMVGLSDELMRDYDDLFYTAIPQDKFPSQFFENGSDYPHEKDMQAVFAELNDEQKMSFNQIADWIEQNVKFI